MSKSAFEKIKAGLEEVKPISTAREISAISWFTLPEVQQIDSSLFDAAALEKRLRQAELIARVVAGIDERGPEVVERGSGPAGSEIGLPPSVPLIGEMLFLRMVCSGGETRDDEERHESREGQQDERLALGRP